MSESLNGRQTSSQPQHSAVPHGKTDYLWRRTCPIPFYEMGAAYYKVWIANGKRDAQSWDDKLSNDFKEALGNAYAKYAPDKLRIWACSFRAHGQGHGGWKKYRQEFNIEGKRNKKNTVTKKRHKVKHSPEYKAHLESDFYLNEVRPMVMRKAPDGKCVCCGTRAANQCHHCKYNRLGTLESRKDIPFVLRIIEEIEDCIPLCVICHEVVDGLRQEAHQEQGISLSESGICYNERVAGNA